MTKQKKEKIVVVIFNFIEVAKKVFASGNKIMNPYYTFELVHATCFNTDVKGHVRKKKTPLAKWIPFVLVFPVKTNPHRVISCVAKRRFHPRTIRAK